MAAQTDFGEGLGCFDPKFVKICPRFPIGSWPAQVLDDGSAQFDMPAFKKSVEEALRQKNVLIAERAVSVVS